MTVKELIEVLNKIADKDRIVMIDTGDDFNLAEGVDERYHRYEGKILVIYA